MKKYNLNIFSIYIFFILFVFGCANQLPPTGGEDDSSPPKMLKIFPLPNSLNYSGNSISIEFDEYIDRRSFKDALFISPKPMGELNYNWSGKKVEIEFPKNLLKNTTYSFVVGKGLKDIRNNSITAPIQFAFSTGASIDNGKIIGKVYAQKSDNLMIFAYINKGVNDSLMNPINKFPDFFTQVNENSQFYFNHLPQGKFRLFALKDNNKNLLFDIGADEISVLNSDINIEDTLTKYEANFFFPDYLPEDNFIFSEKYFSTLTSDTSNSIFSSIKNSDMNIPIDSRFIFYFKNSKLSRFDIAENLKLLDTTEKKYYRLHYNWASDSLLEVISTEELKYSSVMKFIFDFRSSKLKYYYEIIFNVADERKSGNISGKVIDPVKIQYPVFVKIYNQNNKLIFYSKILDKDSLFSFRQIPEGQYIIFSFIDENKNKVYDCGNAYPYKPSEKFVFYEPLLNLKGGWKIDNIFIKF
ncbi:MAG: Ig-like domain-containing protein [Ignavibacteriae bacterium]|nr:Ig-like domain-containing protein [Ignavibacteriota bacterium]